MFKSFKKAIAAIAVFALMVTNAGVVVAASTTSTFTDVSTSAYYYDAVEKLVTAGVVDKTDSDGKALYHPDRAVNRAEAVKMIVKYAGGFTGYKAPSTPTFKDVPTTAWYYDYVVTAYNQSIIDGYGNGKFGPLDNMNRAQFAKVAVNSQSPTLRTSSSSSTSTSTSTSTSSSGSGSLEVSLNNKTASGITLPYSTVGASLASYDFTAASSDVKVSQVVVTRSGVGQTTDWDALYLYDGTKRLTTGRSISSDTNTATFALSSLTITAGTTKTLTLKGDVAADGTAQANNQHSFSITSATAVTSDATSVSGDFPVTGQSFRIGSVSVNSVTITPGSTPSNPQVGAKAANISVFRLAAGSTNDIALQQITLTQNGALSSSKMVNLVLKAGSTEVAKASAFSGDTVTFTLATPYVISKGQTKVFYVYADISGGRPTTDTIDLYLDESSDLVAIDQQYSLGATVTNDSVSGLIAASQVLTLQGGKITVVDGGLAAKQIAQNTTNVKLLDYSITSDRDVTVKNMLLTLKIEETGDITTTDMPDILASAGSDTFVDSVNPEDNLQTGFTTAADHGVGDLNDWDVGDIISATVNSTTYYCVLTSVGTDTTADNSTTDCPSTAVSTGDTISYGLNPYTYLENVRIIDADTGTTLQGPVTTWSATTTLSGDGALDEDDAYYEKVLPEDYYLYAGKTRNLSVVADIDQNMPAGLEIKATVDYSTAGYIKDETANKDIETSDIVGGTLTGKYMTVQQNTLTLAAASSINRTYVQGEKAAEGLKVSMNAGDAGDITVKKLTFRVYADTDTDFTVGATYTGDTAGNTVVSSVSLYDGSTLVAGPESLTLVGTIGASGGYYKAYFDDLSVLVGKGQTKTLTAKMSLLNTLTSTTYLAVDIDPYDDVTAEDSDANTVYANDGSLNLTANPTPTITVATAGSLSVTSTSNSVPAQVVVGGTDDVTVSKYKFEAQNEDFVVDKLTIINDLSGAFDTAADDGGAVEQVRITYPTDAAGTTTTATGNLSTGSYTFSSLNMYVPAGGSAMLVVSADAEAIGSDFYSLSGKAFRLGLLDTGNTSSTFNATASSSSESVNTSLSVSSSSNVNAMTLRKTKPTFSPSTTYSNSPMPGSRETMYKVDVSADSAGAVDIARMVFQMDVYNADATFITDIYDLELFRTTSSGTTEVTDYNIWGIGALSSGNAARYLEEPITSGNGLALANTTAAGVDTGTYYITVTFDDQETILAGETVTYELRGSVTGAATDDTIRVKLATGDESNEVASILSTDDNDSNGSDNSHTGQLIAANGEYATFTVEIVGDADGTMVDGDEIQIGDCTVTFVHDAAGVALDDVVDCSTPGGATIDLENDTGAVDGGNRSSAEISAILSTLTNVYETTATTVGHGELVASVSDATTTLFTAAGMADGDITYVEGLAVDTDVTGTAVTTGVAITNKSLFDDEESTSSTAYTGDAYNEFFGDSVADWVAERNFIWSDQAGGDFASGDTGATEQSPHSYPSSMSGSSTAGDGTFTAGEGDIDWTNGYKLGIDVLPIASFKQN